MIRIHKEFNSTELTGEVFRNDPDKLRPLTAEQVRRVRVFRSLESRWKRLWVQTRSIGATNHVIVGLRLANV